MDLSNTQAKSTARIVITESQCAVLKEPVAPYKRNEDAHVSSVLIKYEQNAWMIAAHSDHCDVVATRTELDWAIKNNRLAIWAPTKMVMDATDTFESYVPASLAIWLGQELDAKSCSLIGAETMDGVNSLPSINDFDISALRR